MATQTSFPTYHRTIKINGLNIFYREAGDASATGSRGASRRSDWCGNPCFADRRNK